jgi:hypothetical protein
MFICFGKLLQILVKTSVFMNFNYILMILINNGSPCVRPAWNHGMDWTVPVRIYGLGPIKLFK